MDANGPIDRKTTPLLIRAAAVVLVAGAFLSGCGKGNNQDKPGPQPATLAALRLNALENCDAYLAYVTDSLVENYRPRDWGNPVRVQGEDGVVGTDPAPAAPATGDAASSSSPTHVTGTNNQEAGVDEPDIVKTDANGILYIARGEKLRIVAGHPPEQLNELATLDAGGAVYDLFLDETNRRAVLFAAHYDQIVPSSPAAASDAITMPSYYMRVQYVVSFVDVADPAQPQLTARWTLDGYPLDARRVGARIHFVLSDPIELPAKLANDAEFWKLYGAYYNATTEAAAAAIEAQIVAAIRAAVAEAGAAEMLPNVTVESNGVSTTGPIVGCGGVRAPQVLTYPNLLTVASFGTDGENLSASAILAHGAEVYASPDNLYITHTSDGWFNSDDYKPQTAIHKFGVADNAPRYVATGLVDGWAGNSFNLSEYQGNLRVATNTTTWSKGTTTSSNDLFVLRDNGDGELVQRGAVRGFGANESMFGVRFLGARGFVVTFRRIDPLFAFDLSDPDAPRLAGELEIPGFSEYLHPLGDNHLLTIGRDALTRGVQLQIFDVSDLAKPALVHKYAPALPGAGYSYSQAEYDHHAFTFDDVNNVLAIPLAYYSYGANSYFNGIAAFDVDVAAGISEIVRVDHGDLANASYCGITDGVAAPCGHDFWYQAYPRRSVIMTADSGVTLYTISDAGVKATGLAPPNDTLGKVVFPVEPPPEYGTPGPVVAE
jgi:hypothetical protein